MVNRKEPINTKKGEEDGSALFVMLMTTWMSLDESEPCIIVRLVCIWVINTWKKDYHTGIGH